MINVGKSQKNHEKLNNDYFSIGNFRPFFKSNRSQFEFMKKYPILGNLQTVPDRRGGKF
jgi:hypothetical protein